MLPLCPIPCPTVYAPGSEKGSKNSKQAVQARLCALSYSLVGRQSGFVAALAGLTQARRSAVAAPMYNRAQFIAMRRS